MTLHKYEHSQSVMAPPRDRAQWPRFTLPSTSNVMKLQTKCAILLCAVFGLSGCADKLPDQVFPALQGGSSDIPVGGTCDPEITTVDALIDAGRFHFAYGKIERVEPVLDRFNYIASTHADQTTCDGYVDPNIRVFLRVENASWDWDRDHLMEIGFTMGAFHQTSAFPVYRSRSGLSWSDGKQYFAKGETLGVNGSFVDHNYFLVSVRSMFEIDENNAISGYPPLSSCYEGNINGRDVDETIQRLWDASKGETPHIPPELLSGPLYSECSDWD